MDALVVGAGMMGRWFGTVLRDADDSVDLAVTDLDEAVARRASSQLGSRMVPPETDERFDLVCLAVPIPVVDDAIASYGPLATDAVVDVTGRMAEPLAAMAEHVSAPEYASFHPLFAPENEPGNVAFVGSEVSTGGRIASILATLERRGNRVFETTADEHDTAMETVQARAHVAVLAYGIAAERVPETFHTPVSDGLTELVEQVTAGDATVYRDIQDAFDGGADVADAAAELVTADRERFDALFEAAGLDDDD